MVNKTKRYKVNEQLRDLADSVKDISDRISKLEIKESIKMDRTKVWSLAAAHVAGAETCRDASAAIHWADNILAAYDNRFN